MRKRILCVLAGAALLAVTPACSLAAESAAEETLETKMEGDGFDTPEEALTAYIEAFKKMDMNGMVSVYAMESFLENLDLEALVEKQQVYSFRTRYNYIPQENPYASALNLEKRRSWITDLVQQQYVTLSGSRTVYRVSGNDNSGERFWGCPKSAGYDFPGKGTGIS